MLRGHRQRGVDRSQALGCRRDGIIMSTGRTTKLQAQGQCGIDSITGSRRMMALRARAWCRVDGVTSSGMARGAQ
jgi:hypothetical protein